MQANYELPDVPIPTFINIFNELSARPIQIYNTIHLNKIKHDCQSFLYQTQMHGITRGPFSSPHSGKAYSNISESSTRAASVRVPQ